MEDIHIRWSIRRDLPELLQCGTGWTEDDFRETLRRRDCIGLVAELPGLADRRTGDCPVVGVVVYQMHKARLEVLAFGVVPEYRGIGVGEAMVARLRAKLSSHRRRKLVFRLPDDDLQAHLFLRDQGFRAEKVERGPEGDTYQFVLRVSAEALVVE